MSTAPWNPTTHPSIRQVLRGVFRCVVALSFLTLAARANAECANPSITTYKWCSSLDIPIWWGEGMGGVCSGTSSEALECQRWRAAVRAAMQEFNPGAVIELETAPFFMEAGAWDGSPTGIVIRLEHLGYIDCAGGSGFSEALGKMKPHPFPSTAGPLRPLQWVEITFNLDVPWSNTTGTAAFHRTTVARHELMHALGVGHSSGGICLMNTTLPCGWSSTIEESAWASLRCLYGDPWGSCSNLYGIDATNALAATVDFWIAGCGCTAGGCSTAEAAQRAQPAAVTYELAISESGGPYTVFATLPESELADHQYSHEFTQSYQSAMIRMRVLNGASLVDESFILTPVTIEAIAAAAPPDVAPQQPLRLLSAPNPFTSETTVSFALAAEQAVDINIYDMAGRRVATVHSGTLGAGQHEFVWNGRLDNGRGAASGIYRCAVRTATGITTRTLAKLR